MVDLYTEIFEIQFSKGVSKFNICLTLIHLHTLRLVHTDLGGLGYLFFLPFDNFPLPVKIPIKRFLICKSCGQSDSEQGVGYKFVNHHNYRNQYNKLIQTDFEFRKKQRKMLENFTLQLDCKKIKEQNDLKKQLPKGACTFQEHKKYEYIRSLMRERYVYRYILPVNRIYSPFVVIKRSLETERYPIFQLYYHPTNTFILSAQEQNMNIGCNYIISSTEKPSKNEFFIAKLRGNFNRNQFNLFDNGNNPEKSKNNPRRQFAFIKIEENNIWNKNNRLAMYVPKAYESNRSISDVHKYQPIEFPCHSSNPNPIFQDFKDKYNTVEHLQLKQTKLSPSKSASSTSVILESTFRTQSVLVRRKSETFFELQIGTPLTIVQGFGFLLALLQSKMI